MYDLPLRGMNTFPNYAADNRQFKKMRTLKGAFFLPSYINCTSYIVPSYINFTSYIVPSYIFLAIFLFFLAHVQKKSYLCTRLRKLLHHEKHSYQCLGYFDDSDGL